MRTLAISATLLLALTACGGGENSEPAPAETVTATVTEPAAPAETVTIEAAATGRDLEPLCDDFRRTAISVAPKDAFDNGFALDAAVRAELDPTSGQYAAMMAVVGALFHLGYADEGLSIVSEAQTALLGAATPVFTVCGE